MFQSLPHTFRKHHIQADVRVLLQLRRAIEKGLVNTTGDLYVVLKGLLTNDPKEFGPYTTAFYEYFLDVEVGKGESLETALLRSQTFQDWKKERIDDDLIPDIKDLIDRFLDEVHLTTLDIKKVIDGADILNQDNPDAPDTQTDENPEIPTNLDKAVDYSNIPLEEILERMKRVAQQQRERHFGGSHWIGSGGTSPYGNNGAAPGGVRTGGTGGGKMARAILNDAKFFPVDTHSILKDDNIDAALAALKGIEDESAEVIFDIPTTITEGLKQGGIFLPYEREKITQKVQVILMIDNGGYSMTPYIRHVQKLFSKMKTRFAHDLKTYYYHNTIYGGAYSDVRRRNFVSMDKITSLDKNYSVFVIGDADMAPYELGRQSLETWQALRERFKRIAWMNPLPEKYWYGSDTVPMLGSIVPMYPLTPHGIGEAVVEMNYQRKYAKR